MTSTISFITFVFWAVAGFITFGVCIVNARKTRGGAFSGAFTLLGWGTLLLALSAIVITFFGRTIGTDIARLLHDVGFVTGFIFVLSASNRFLKAMTG